MPVAPLVQLPSGGTVSVGVGTVIYGTLIEATATVEPFATVKKIKDSDAATAAKLITNPGKKITIKGVMLAADLSALESLSRGDTVLLNGIKHMLDSLDMDFHAEESRCTIVGIKEDSMTYP